ncbi:hypothetical protein GGR52DRAFT_574892 [Hypoxylon sp. FL1284]|nr:hypothetical protein GGR52DRAFT_574892 [Hypoxylon sp. FL1284]
MAQPMVEANMAVTYPLGQATLELVEVRSVPGMGFGMFAKENIYKDMTMLIDTSLLDLEIDGATPEFADKYADLSRGMSLYLDNAAFSPMRYNDLKESVTDILRRWWAQKNGKVYTRSQAEYWSPYLEKILRAFSIFGNNAADISFGASRPGGPAAFYPMFSRFNHSCMPSADWELKFGTNDRVPDMHITAQRPIRKGEQIFLSYDYRVDLTDPPLDRQGRHAILMEGWGFVCTCPRCEAERTV